MHQEIKDRQVKGTLKTVQRHQLSPALKVSTSQFVFKDGITGAKARLVVQEQPSREKLAFAPTTSATEFRILCALATEQNHPIHSCHIGQIMSKNDELYVNPPVDYGFSSDVVWKLTCEMSVANRKNSLRKFVENYGFSSINNSDTFFMLKSSSNDVIRIIFNEDSLALSFSNDDSGLQFKTACTIESFRLN